MALRLLVLGPSRMRPCELTEQLLQESRRVSLAEVETFLTSQRNAAKPRMDTHPFRDRGLFAPFRRPGDYGLCSVFQEVLVNAVIAATPQDYTRNHGLCL